MKTKALFFASCFVLFALAMESRLAFAWGPGHDTLARAVAVRLPEPWKNRLQDPGTLRQFIKDGHYPDSFEPFDAARIGEKGMRYLEDMKMKTRYSLHSDAGRAVAFSLMVEAMRDDNADRVFLWFAALLHSAADMPACNHDPLIHAITYIWGEKDWNLNIPMNREGCVDLAWVEKYDWSKTIFEQRLDAARIADDGADAEEAMLRVMLYGFEGTDAASPYNRTIVEDGTRWAVEKDREAGERLAEAISRLGLWAAVRGIRDFEAALRLAKRDDFKRYDERLSPEFNRRADEILRKVVLANDSVAKNFLPDDKTKSPAVAVLYEPIWRMNEGMFGFNDRLQACQIVGSLRTLKRPAGLVDIREFQERGIPDVSKFPLLVVSAQSFNNYRILKRDVLCRQFKDYLERGGKILWIGGTKPPREIAPQMHVALKTQAQSSFPFPVEKTLEQVIAWEASGEPKVQWRFTRPLKGKAGWSWPRNPGYFESDERDAFKIFLRVAGPEGTFEIGAASDSVVYLPNYAVFPYVLTEEKPELAPLKIELDATGNFLLDKSLRKLLAAGAGVPAK